MSNFKIPFGDAKGQDIEVAETRHIEWVRKKVADSLAADPNKPYADKDRALVAAIDAEVARRKAGGAAAAPQGARAPLAKREVSNLAASYRQGIEANKALQQAAEVAHLVSPATAVGELPAGCVLALSQVVVSAGDEDTYGVSGKRGLLKHALDRIAGAAGISWDPCASGRLDDGRDPYYCHYRAAGSYRAFDGARVVVSGEVEIDLRDGSPQIESEKQLAQARKFILRHAESKAKNRAIRSLGVKTSYKAEELNKPFVVAKVMFTGHSEDPEIKRAFAMATANAFLSGTGTLYPAQLPARSSARGHAPPPVEERETYDAAGESSPEHEPPFQGQGEDLDPADSIPY